MMTIRTILHPTDFSGHSERAFRLACSLARDHGAGLLVLHVLPAPASVGYDELPLTAPLSPEYRQQVNEKLWQLKPVDAEVAVDYRLEEGFAVTEILRVAAEAETDLIVMGTHGRTGLGRLLLGSVAEQVLRKAPCPVLMVKTPAAAAKPDAEAHAVAHAVAQAVARG